MEHITEHGEMNRKRLKNHKRLVIKIGTTSLTYNNGKINLRLIDRLAWTIADLMSSGLEIVLVSSGAIAVGAERLGIERPRDTVGKQAASAVGQALLMQIYENMFSSYNQKIAQVLLTRDVFEDVTRNNNAQNTFNKLISMKVIPIVNENDTVSTDELEFSFSENDNLSSYVAQAICADMLINLSDTDGFYDSDPKINQKAELITEIYEIDATIKKLAGGSRSSLGTGGMAAKLSAAEILIAKNIDMVIASGDDPSIIYKIINGEAVGTLFTNNKNKT